MRHQLLSTLERFTPRLLSAAVALLAGYLVGPAAFGVYALGTLAYTLFQSISEGAMRQVLPQAVSTVAGRTFLHRYRQVVPALAMIVLLPVMLAIALANGYAGASSFALVPIALATIPNALGISYVGALQTSANWRALARNQVIGAATGFSVGVALALWTRSIAGPAIGLFVSEFVIASLNYRAAQRRPETPLAYSPSGAGADEPSTSTGPFRMSDFAHFAGYSGLAWSQGQVERLIMGVAGSTALLGQFSMASTIARSGADAVAQGTANLLRTLPAAASPDVIERRLRIGVGLAFVVAVASVALGETVVLPALGPDWSAAASALPILAVSSVPAVLNWSAAALHMRNGTARRALASPIVGLAFAVPVAVAATRNLEAGALMLVARETAMCVTTYALLGRNRPTRALWLAAAALLALAALAAGVSLNLIA